MLSFGSTLGSLLSFSESVFYDGYLATSTPVPAIGRLCPCLSATILCSFSIGDYFSFGPISPKSAAACRTGCGAFSGSLKSVSDGEPVLLNVPLGCRV